MDRRDFLAATAGSTFLLATRNADAHIAQWHPEQPQCARSISSSLMPVGHGTTDAPCPAVQISDAEKPFPTDPAWRQAVVPALNAQFVLPTPSAPLPEDLTALYLPFSRSFAWAEPDDNQYRYLQAELLLNQAADLLDRGVRDRTEWNDYAVKRFNLNLELLEFARLDAIHEQEIECGIYTSVAKLSQAELDATNASASHNQAAVTTLSDELSKFYSDGAINLAASVASNQAYGSIVPMFQKERQDMSGGGPHMTYALWDGSSGASKEDIVMKTADFQTRQTMQSVRDNINAQSENINAAAASDTKRVPGLQAKAGWDTSNTAFQYQRTQVSRDMEIAKVKAATETAGVLNYGERMRPIRQRADLDFQESLAKLSATAKGLRLLYGYDVELPRPGGVEFFDDCLLWVRKAINWLVRFRQLEQSFVLPISVKDLTPDWRQSCQSGQFSFNVPPSALAYMRHVRLRGLSVLTVVKHGQEDPASLFQATVVCPRTSTCVHLSGRTETLNQEFVPPCRIGRVTYRGNIREPDVVGSTALYNVSPIGSWQLSINTKSSTGEKLDSLTDIQLDLHLAFRTSEKE